MIEPARPRAAPPAVIVSFGAAGDLTRRKLGPALFNLAYPASSRGPEEANELLTRDGYTWKNTQ